MFELPFKKQAQEKRRKRSKKWVNAPWSEQWIIITAATYTVEYNNEFLD